MDFTPNNPNLTNPGGSFSEAFGRGQQLGFQKQQLAQQNTLAMAQLGENQRQFDLVQQLHEQELDLNRQKTMADLSMMGTQQKLMGIQIDQQQFQADQLPKQAANQAYIQQAMAATDTFDPVTGASTFASKLSNVPHPEALNPVESNQLQIQVADRNSKTQLGQSLAAQNVAQTNDINSFVQMGGDVKPFLIDPKGLTVPQNVNMAALGQASRQIQTQLFQTQQDIATKAKLSEIQATGDQRLDYANALSQGRATTTDERSLVQRANSAMQNVRDLIRAGASSSDIDDAKTESEHWNNELQNFRANRQGGSNTSNASSDNSSSSTPNPNDWSTYVLGNPALHVNSIMTGGAIPNTNSTPSTPPTLSTPTPTPVAPTGRSLVSQTQRRSTLDKIATQNETTLANVTSELATAKTPQAKNQIHARIAVLQQQAKQARDMSNAANAKIDF